MIGMRYETVQFAVHSVPCNETSILYDAIQYSNQFYDNTTADDSLQFPTVRYNT